MSLSSRSRGPSRRPGINPGVPVAPITVSFSYPSAMATSRSGSVSVPPPSQAIPTSTVPTGLRAWSPGTDPFVMVTEEPASKLPSDGILYDKVVDPATGVVGYKPHTPPEDDPSAPFGREYALREIQRQLEIEQNAIYAFLKLLNGAIYNKSASTATLGGLWTSGSAGDAAVRTIFTNFLSSQGALAGGSGTGSIIDPSAVIEPVKQRLIQGLEDSVGAKAAQVNGLTDEASRTLAANIAVGAAQHRALDFAERAVKIANTAKDLPDALAGNLVRDVIGIGGMALSNQTVGIGPPLAGAPQTGDLPPPSAAPAPKAPAPPPKAPAPPGPKGQSLLPVTPIPSPAPAVPKGALVVPAGTDDLAGKTPSEVALILAKRQIVNADYQLYQIMQDNPTEAKLRAWDLLYFNGERYIRPKSLASVVKDIEAARTVERILNGVTSAASKGMSLSNAVAHFRSVENTGMLFIDSTVEFAIRRAYDYLRYTHGQQSIPLVSFMTQESVNARFAELVAILYHRPPGASQPRGSTASSVVDADMDLYLLGKWLARCRMVGFTIVAPDTDLYALEQRRRKERSIDQFVQATGKYPTSDSLVAPKRVRSAAAARREEENRKAIQSALGWILSG